ncbi:MAG: molybdenum cofactor guanylyltransferase [Pseudoflavonifractor sp.]
MEKKSVGALVLAGGGARRMQGRSKALLEVGGETFLQRLALAFSAFDERLIATGDPLLAAGSPFRPVADRMPDRGPLEGICAALAVCRSDALVVVACDMPFFTAELAEYLAAAYRAGDCPVLALRDRAGGNHPLCGVYAKAALPALDAVLAAGQRRVRAGLDAAGGRFLSLADSPFPDRLLTNINTPEELAAL